MTTIAPKVPDAPVAETDEAETFDEGAVTVTGTNHVVANESVGIGILDTVSYAYSGGSWVTSTEGGIVVNPNQSINGLELTLATASGDQATADAGAAIEDLSDNSTVAETSETINPGDTITLSASLSAGQAYAVYVRATSSVKMARSDDSVPTTSTAIDVEDGWTDSGRGTNDDPFAISNIDVPATSATVHVEWPMPPDVYAWDVGVYQRSGIGSVDVFVEEETDSGWTEIAGPIKRGDSLPADPSNNVRYRVELSRSSTSNDPSLDAIYRRRKL